MDPGPGDEVVDLILRMRLAAYSVTIAADQQKLSTGVQSGAQRPAGAVGGQVHVGWHGTGHGESRGVGRVAATLAK